MTLRYLSFCVLLLFCLPSAAIAALANYGRLSGTVVRSGIDDDYTGTRHYEIFVDAPAPAGSCATWRVDINLQNVDHRFVVLNALRSDWFGAFPTNSGLATIPFGNLASEGRGALDYMRHPGLLDAIRGRPWSTNPLLQGGGTSASAPALDNWLRGARRVHAFGEVFPRSGSSSGNCVQRGVHNVHQNQGSARSSAGVWQDGGIVVEHERWLPLFSPFNFQFLGWTTYIERTALMTKFRDQSDFADGDGRSLTPGMEGAIFYGGQWVGPFVADQLVFRATALQLNRYDPRFQMVVWDAYGNVLADSDGADVDGVVEFIRTYRAGPVWVEVDAAAGSTYELRANNAWD